MPFAASPTFGFLYRSTVAYFPEAFLLMLICIYVLLFFLVLGVHISMHRVDTKARKEVVRDMKKFDGVRWLLSAKNGSFEIVKFYKVYLHT